MTYFDKIRSLNNLQLSYFLNQIQAQMPMVALALDRASNPEIYCSEDNFAIGTPNNSLKGYEETYEWFKNLSADFDEVVERIFGDDKESREFLRGWKDE